MATTSLNTVSPLMAGMFYPQSGPQRSLQDFSSTFLYCFPSRIINSKGKKILPEWVNPFLKDLTQCWQTRTLHKEMCRGPGLSANTHTQLWIQVHSVSVCGSCPTFSPPLVVWKCLDLGHEASLLEDCHVTAADYTWLSSVFVYAARYANTNKSSQLSVQSSSFHCRLSAVQQTPAH